MGVRVGIIGPRRSRTGTGPYVARFLRECGCEVYEWIRDDAARFARESPPSAVDAVAICSPPETHFDFVAAALRNRLHVFCEKPMLWPGDHSPRALRGLMDALAAIAAPARREVVLHENTQWRYTLSDYDRLVGEHARDDVREFSCELAPSSGNPEEMVMEAAPHANSLLLALGCRGMEDPSVAFRQAGEHGGASLEIRFASRSAGKQAVRVHYRFEQCTAQPRPAAYAANGRWVRRRIESPGYRFFFCYEAKEVASVDPLERSVRDFVRKVRDGSPPRDEEEHFRAILENLDMSARILERIGGPPYPRL